MAQKWGGTGVQGAFRADWRDWRTIQVHKPENRPLISKENPELVDKTHPHGAIGRPCTKHRIDNVKEHWPARKARPCLKV
jgi:hypothetical protein